MRVIGGSAKGLRLKKVPGDSTRPIMDRVKENLFNILGDWVVGSVWLDLFAGTGQVGIEALSRGASLVVFVDNEIQAIRVIRKNLAHTGLDSKSTIIHTDAFKFINRSAGHEFDVVYVAPPQYNRLWSQALGRIDQAAEEFISQDGVVIVQIDPKEYRELVLNNLALYDRRRYGRTLLCFYELAGSKSS